MMATHMAEPITVRGRPSLEDTLARWLTEDPKLLEEALIEGSFGRASNSRLERVLQGGKGSLLRKVLGIPEAEKQLFSFEQMKAILRDSRKVPSLEEMLLQQAPDAGHVGESKGQTLLDFPKSVAGREIGTPRSSTAMLGEASPPDMVGPDVVPAPGPKLYGKARVQKGNRGLALVQDKLFGEKRWSESGRPSADTLQEGLEAAQKYNETSLTKEELRAFLNKELSPAQMKAVAAKLQRPFAGVENVRHHAMGKLFQQGKVLESEVAAGLGGKGLGMQRLVRDEIQNRLGGFTHRDIKSRVGVDILEGMTEQEQNKLIQTLKEQGRRAKGSMAKPVIPEELGERFADAPLTESQAEARALVDEFQDIRGSLGIKPTELGAREGGTTTAKWAADKNKMLQRYAEFDKRVGGDFRSANKFMAALLEDHPDLKASDFQKILPQTMKKVFGGIANNLELMSDGLVKPWDFGIGPNGHVLYKGKEVPLSLLMAQATANQQEVSALKATGIRKSIPSRKGEDLTRVAGSAEERVDNITRNRPRYSGDPDMLDPRTPPFMQDEVEAARAAVRSDPGKPNLRKLKPTTNPESVAKLDPALKKVLDKKGLLQNTLPAGADNASAHVSALVQAIQQGRPLPSKQATVGALTEASDEALASADDWGDTEAAKFSDEVSTGRAAQNAAEREMGTLPEKVAPNVRVASEMKAGEKGLMPTDRKQIVKFAEWAKQHLPGFQDVDVDLVRAVTAEGSKVRLTKSENEGWKKLVEAYRTRDARRTQGIKGMALDPLRANEGRKVSRLTQMAEAKKMKAPSVAVDADQVLSKLGPEATPEMMTKALQEAGAVAEGKAASIAARVAKANTNIEAAKRLQKILRLLIVR